MTQSHSENPLVIAIDGASGSGKSSTARGVAKRLGLAYLDTGAMYRAVTVAYLDSGVDGADPAAVNQKGEDAIDIARQKGNATLASALEKILRDRRANQQKSN